jgi:hypothetical protein
MKNQFLTLVIFLLTFTTTCFPQSAWIVKRECSEKHWDNIYEGFALEVFFLNAKDTINSSSYWETNPFLAINDSLKLIIIQQLLTLENDTSLCCRPAASHFHGGDLACRCLLEGPIDVSLQVDALYRINIIAYPDECSIYSCYPVLYDKIDKKVINDKPVLIKEVYKEYKEWYAECKKNSKIGGYFPFNEGRYVWYCGKKSFYQKGE